MGKRLEGKVAVITGAASGQGAAAAEMFSAEGCRVAAFDINESGLQAVADRIPGILPVVCDLTSEVDVERGVLSTIEAFGKLDVLYNNAGLATRRPGDWDDSQDGLLTDVTSAEFDRNIAVNLKSHFLTSKYCLPHMMEAGGGSVINVSSTVGPVIATGNTAYNTAKAGIIGLTRTTALNYGKYNIRANSLLPGVVVTPLMDHITEDIEYVKRWEARHPMRRMAQASELAAVGLFLASDESSYVNGASIVADGGLTINAM